MRIDFWSTATGMPTPVMNAPMTGPSTGPVGWSCVNCARGFAFAPCPSAFEEPKVLADCPWPKVDVSFELAPCAPPGPEFPGELLEELSVDPDEVCEAVSPPGAIPCEFWLSVPPPTLVAAP